MSKHTNPESIREMFTRHDNADDLHAALDVLDPSARRLAMAWLWGTMTVRDPQACIEALEYARDPGAWLAEKLGAYNTEQANDRS